MHSLTIQLYDTHGSKDAAACSSTAAAHYFLVSPIAASEAPYAWKVF